jgi:hypothetical protein
MPEPPIIVVTARPLPPQDASADEVKSWVRTWICERGLDDDDPDLEWCLPRFNMNGQDIHQISEQTLRYKFRNWGFTYWVTKRIIVDIMRARAWEDGAVENRKADEERRKLCTLKESAVGKDAGRQTWDLSSLKGKWVSKESASPPKQKLD